MKNNFILNTWLCYYKCESNQREGVEILHAKTREEAIAMYRRFFNVSGPVVCVPRVDLSTRDGVHRKVSD